MVVLLGLGAWHLAARTRSELPVPPAYVRSGIYPVLGVCSDGSLLVSHIGDSGQRMVLRVVLLGVELVERDVAVGVMRTWLRTEVRIRFDRRRLTSDGLLTAYVFVGDRLINAELLRLGWGCAATHPADSGPLRRQLQAAEQEAQTGKLGIWSTRTASAMPVQRVTIGL